MRNSDVPRYLQHLSRNHGHCGPGALASASRGLLPAPWLPRWLGALRGLLPMSVALTGIRDAVYFSGVGVIHAQSVLSAR
ncbi:hypothetical protein [Acidithrix ferrooxidans]|uniref:hypothetical protein n=1 Tax=Acidithrix ferrooxidans TaxID=1280514 RepID=UPI001269A6BB|nr:hypothetical protein [Acidithrix ferrooxidans]